MKKIFSIVVFAAAFAFAFTSCKKTEPEVPADFKITVDSLTMTSAFISVEPLDTSIGYYWSVYKASDFANLANDSIATLIKNNLDFTIMFAEYFGFELTYDSLLSKGPSSYKFEGFAVNTEYIVFAVKVDSEGKCDFEVSSQKSFKTPDVVLKGQENLVIEGGEFVNAVEDEGWYQISGYNAKGDYYLSLSPDPVESLNDAVTMDNLDGDYSYLVNIFGSGKNDYELFSIVKADLQGSFDKASGVLTVTGKFVAENGIEYNLTMSGIEAEDDSSFAPQQAAAKKPTSDQISARRIADLKKKIVGYKKYNFSK